MTVRIRHALGCSLPPPYYTPPRFPGGANSVYRPLRRPGQPKAGIGGRSPRLRRVAWTSTHAERSAAGDGIGCPTGRLVCVPLRRARPSGGRRGRHCCRGSRRWPSAALTVRPAVCGGLRLADKVFSRRRGAPPRFRLPFIAQRSVGLAGRALSKRWPGLGVGSRQGSLLRAIRVAPAWRFRRGQSDHNVQRLATTWHNGQ
jgi:hypothetical protein